MDRLIFSYVHNWVGRLALFDFVVVFLAEYLPYVMAAAFIVLIFAEKNKAKRFYFILLSTLSLLVARGLVTEIVRFIYPRLRPFSVLDFQALIAHPGSAAFPSGHAVVFFVLSAAVFFVNKNWFYCFLGAASLNALARVYVGVHWPSDVAAGAVVGALTVLVLRRFLPRPGLQ